MEMVQRGSLGSWRNSRLTPVYDPNTIVETLQQQAFHMATVNFSVPDEIKEAFNKEFEGQNKSAVIADLMRKAVEDAKAHKRRAQAIDEILEFRQRTDLPVMTDDEIRQVRDEGRS